MNLVTNLNALVVANEALVVVVLAVALVLLQIAIILYAAFSKPSSEDVDAARTNTMSDDEMQLYTAYGISPWMY